MESNIKQEQPGLKVIRKLVRLKILSEPQESAEIIKDDIQGVYIVALYLKGVRQKGRDTQFYAPGAAFMGAVSLLGGNLKEIAEVEL
jgi:hypothetical protein